jgi:hypothetical protein
MQTHFKMPEIKIGTLVLFYVGADRTQVPAAAMVTGIGQRNVILSVFQPNTYNLLIRDGVRHMNDPDLNHNADIREMGGWDYTDDYKLLLELKEKVSYLMSQDVPLETDHELVTAAKEGAKRGPGRPRKEEAASA